MPRTTRTISEANLYHVMARGVGRQIIFEDDKDRQHFVDLLSMCLPKFDGDLLAWCLMSNHIHLLFNMELEPLSSCMRVLESSYASYFNHRHDRVGHLFQGRFSSEAIDDDPYLLTVVRYIHLNPVESNIARLEEYRWSSYREYLMGGGLCSPGFVIGVYGGIDEFVRRHLDEDRIELPVLTEYGPVRCMDDDRARTVAEQTIGEETLRRLPSLERDERNAAIVRLKKRGFTIKQIERLTGIGRGIIQRSR